jgi:hypothetical protein
MHSIYPASACGISVPATMAASEQHALSVPEAEEEEIDFHIYDFCMSCAKDSFRRDVLLP